MDLSFLRDLLIIFSLSIGVLLICHRLNIPSVVGFLFTGLMVGPEALGFVRQVGDVENLSSIGVVFLLFSIGLEFSLRRILKHIRVFLWGGLIQVTLTLLAGFLIAIGLNRPVEEAVFLGFILSLSSTAIVLKLLQEHHLTTTPQGRAATGILVFQDIIAIPMLLILPFIQKGGQTPFSADLFYKIILVLGLLGATFWASLQLMPRLLLEVSKTKNRELFLLTILVICFAIAWVTSELGLSLSIGAFLAGLLISDSEYSMEAIGDVIPIRDLFMSLFFISIGMLFNVRFLWEHLFLLLALGGGVILMKSFLASFSLVSIGYPLRIAILTGLSLAQIGEFSFVLVKEGVRLHIGNEFLYQLFLGTTFITMALTPYLIGASHSIADFIMRLPLADRWKKGYSPELIQEEKCLNDHVIIIGFGVAGQNLAKVLKEARIPYLIFETNIDLTHEKKGQGEPILYGDATHLPILVHGCIRHARALAILINDPAATLRIIEAARKENPEIYIISRTRKVQDMEGMAKKGADDIVPDEFGASIEILTRILQIYQIPSEVVESLIFQLRNEAYKNIKTYKG